MGLTKILQAIKNKWRIEICILKIGEMHHIQNYYLVY